MVNDKMTKMLKKMSEKEREISPIGRSLKRKDLDRKIDGSLIYGADLNIDRDIKDLQYIAVKKSPYAHAIIKRIDTGEARELEGVTCILTHENVPDIKFTTAAQVYPEPSPYDTRILNEKVRYYGEPVAIVAAENKKIAEKAKEKIKVYYEKLPVILDPEESLESKVKIHADGNIVTQIDVESGDIEDAFKKSQRSLETEYILPIQKHIHLEPHSCLTYLEEDTLTIESTAQAPFLTRRILSRVLEHPLNKIRVKSTNIGGGFGDKQEVILEPAAALITIETGKPVFFSLDREEEFYLSRRRHNVKIKVKSAFDENGKINAFVMSCLSDTGAYGSHGPTVTADIGVIPLTLYDVENLRYKANVVYTNKTIAGAFRGYGMIQGNVAVESHINKIAEILKIDQIEIRKKNLQDHKNHLPIGDEEEIIRSSNMIKALERAREEFNWWERKKSVESGRGIGLACGRSISGVAGYEHSTAIMKLEEDGSVTLLSGATDIGQGSNTVLCQIAASASGIKYDDIQITSADTKITPSDSGTFASSVTYVSGKAVFEAAEKMREEIITMSSIKLEADPGGLDIKKGKIIRKDSGDILLDVKEIAIESVYSPDHNQIITIGHSSPNVSPPPFSVHIVELSVDKETGIVSLENYLTVNDCGQIINPKAAEGQIEGGVVQGIGYALYEEVKFDSKGRILNPNLLDYKTPSSVDVPDIETIFLDLKEPSVPHKSKSTGEIGIIPVGAAVLNAVENAAGSNFNELPLTPERISLKLNK